MDSNISFGKIRYIEEIIAEPPSGSVRTVGRIAGFIPGTNNFTLEHNQKSLTVQTTLLDANLALKTGGLFMFIGEIQADDEDEAGRVLKARVGRSVEGMDMELFGSALEIRRKFEEELSRVPGGMHAAMAHPQGAAAP